MRTSVFVFVGLAGCVPSGGKVGRGNMEPQTGPVRDAADSDEDADLQPTRDSGEPPPVRRTCAALQLSPLEVHTALKGDTTAWEARLALPGPGLGVGDVTGDGHLDVVLARPGAPALLFEGDGRGGLRLLDAGLPQGDTVALGLLNEDARLDMVFAGSGVDVVLLSMPDGRWSETALPQATRHTTTVSVFDADGDGDLDLFMPRHRWPADLDAITEGRWTGDGHALMKNDGSGRFSVDEHSLGGVYDSLALHAAPVDVDLDGDLDIYLNNDFGAYTQPNVTLENDGAGRLDLRADDGTGLAMYAMGTSVADPSGDGWPDLFVTNIGNVVLLRSMGDGTFVEAAAANGLVDIHDAHHIASWGSRFVDVDGDAHDDLVIGYSTVPNVASEPGSTEVPGTDEDEGDRERSQQDIVMMALPDRSGFVSAAATGHEVASFEHAHGTKSLVVADLDSDGRPELIKAGYSVDFDDLVLRTYAVSGGCGPGITLRFPLDAEHVGAKVVAEVEGHRVTRWMLPGAIYGSSAPEVHVGLGELSTIERLEVTTLSGRRIDLSGSGAGTVVELPGRLP